MSKKVMKWKPIVVVALVAVVGCAAAGFGTTYAANTGKTQMENNLKSYTVSSDIKEEFDPDTAQVAPDTKVPKVVSIENTGTAPAFVRVSLTPTWTDNSDPENPVQLSNHIFLDSENEIDLAILSSELDDASQTEEFKKNWTKGSDGWYYYNYILAPGETTPSVLEYVSFSSELSGDAIAAIYKNAGFDVTVLQEVVQVSDEAAVNSDATKALFGKEGTVTTDPGDATEPVYDTKTGNYTSGYVSWTN